MVMPAALKERSLDALDGGTRSSLQATIGVEGIDFLALSGLNICPAKPVVHRLVRLQV